MSFLCENAMPILFNISINDLHDGTEYSKSIFIPVVFIDRMRGSWHKVKCRKFRLNFFTVLVVKY